MAKSVTAPMRKKKPTQPAPKPTLPAVTWGPPSAPVVEVSAPVFPPEHAAKRNGFSLLFDTLRVSLDDATTALSGAVCGRAELPVSRPAKATMQGYRTQTRFSVTKTPGARVILFVEVGGATRTVEFPFDDTDGSSPAADGSTRSLELVSSEHRVPAQQKPGEPPLPPLLVTVFISAVRRTLQDQLLMVVDSVDGEAILG